MTLTMLTDKRQSTNPKVDNFNCTKCHTKQHHTEMDFRQRVATCKTCAPEYSAERITGPWLMKDGEPRLASTRTA
jgi:hypothetical protein